MLRKQFGYGVLRAVLLLTVVLGTVYSPPYLKRQFSTFFWLRKQPIATSPSRFLQKTLLGSKYAVRQENLIKKNKI